MATVVFRLLPNDEWRILKHIIIVAPRHGTEIELGRILYKRKLQPDYIISKEKVEDASNPDAFVKFIHEYPKQENYPTDATDEILLAAVRDIYPASTTRSDTIATTLHNDKLEIWKKRLSYQASFIVYPRISDLSNAHQIPANTLQAQKYPCHIYSYYQPEHIPNMIFYGCYGLSHQTEVLSKLAEVEFQ
jgi:hypothetical protein